VASRVRVHLPGGHLKLTQLCNVWEQRHSGGPNFNIRDNGPGHAWQQKLTHVLPPKQFGWLPLTRGRSAAQPNCFFMPIDNWGLSVPTLILVRKPPGSTRFKKPNIERKRHFSNWIVSVSRPVLSASLKGNNRLDEFDGHLILQCLGTTSRNQ